MTTEYYDQIQDVVDAIEREAFIEVPKGYGVQVANGVFDISFGEVLDEDELRMVEDIAYDYTTSSRMISSNKGGGRFKSVLTIRF